MHWFLFYSSSLKEMEKMQITHIHFALKNQLLYWVWNTDLDNNTCEVHEILSVFIFLHEASGFLVPWPEIQPVPPAAEDQGPNNWTTKEFQGIIFFNMMLVALFLLPYS